MRLETTRRRGFLVKPDPTKTDVCARPGCGDPEGSHLICGCDTFHAGKACVCPGFALPAPVCPDCGHVFDSVWMFKAHRRFPPKECQRAAARRERDEARERASRAYRDAHNAKAGV